MSADVLANAGLQPVTAGKYQEGIEKLSQALKEKPAPRWLLERSKAYMRTNDFDLALDDAEHALHVAFQRANRDLMTEAQIRRAITLFRMGRFADADVCAFWATRLVDGVKATEQDGQESRVDDKGDYTVTSSEVQASNQAAKGQGLQEAMSRSKDKSYWNQAFTWRIQSLNSMEKTPVDSPGRKVTVVKYPAPKPPLEAAKSLPQSRVEELEDSDEEKEAPKPKIPRSVLSGRPEDDATTWEDVFKQFRAQHIKDDVRTDFYQSDSTINVSFFVKNVPADGFKVEAGEQSVRIPLGVGTAKRFTNPRAQITMSPVPSIPAGAISMTLYDKIQPTETQYTVKSMKIELVLKKAVPGKWPMLRKEGTVALDKLDAFVAKAKKVGHNDPSGLALDKSGGDEQAWYKNVLEKLRGADEISDAKIPSAASTAQPAQASEPSQTRQPATAPAGKEMTSTKAAGPAYPTSSKSGPKNWDALAVDDDEEDKEDVNKFFQKIYQAGDDDMKRAMMKSYVESNGTSLSTSWDDAGRKDYKTQPPEGVEAKKW